MEILNVCVTNAIILRVLGSNGDFLNNDDSLN